MQCFCNASLTEAGSLALEDRFEIVLFRANSVTVRPAGKSSAAASHHVPPAPPALQNGLLYVTTHRLVWLNPVARSAYALPLQRVPPNALREPSRSVSTALHHLILPLKPPVKLSFGSSTGRDDRVRATASLHEALRRRAWALRAAAQSTAPSHPGPSPHTAQHVGIQGLCNTELQRSAAHGAALSAAFASLDALRERADVVLQLAERFRAIRSGAGAAGAGAAVDNDGTPAMLLELAVDAGIVSPVTRTSVGRHETLYHAELAREMGDALREVVARGGGCLPLADAYMVMNRMRRAVEMVSPDDFVAAAEVLEGGGAGLQLVRLESGVRALAEVGGGGRAGWTALREEAELEGWVSAVGWAGKRRIPLKWATEMLENAEKNGFLARDESRDGLRFFPNLFYALSGGGENGVGS